MGLGISQPSMAPRFADPRVGYVRSVMSSLRGAGIDTDGPSAYDNPTGMFSNAPTAKPFNSGASGMPNAVGPRGGLMELQDYIAPGPGGQSPFGSQGEIDPGSFFTPMGRVSRDQMPQLTGTGPGIAGSLLSIPGALLSMLDGGMLSQHLINLGQLAGGVIDAPINAFRPIAGLPGGQDVTAAFNALPMSVQKQAYIQAMMEDPLHREAFMLQYVQAHAEDLASLQGVPRIFGRANAPVGALSQQLSQIIFGALSAPQSVIARQLVGMRSDHDLLTQDENTPEEVAQLQNRLKTDPNYTKDMFLDDLTGTAFRYTKDDSIFGTLLTLGIDVLTDPLTWATLGVGKGLAIADDAVNIAATLVRRQAKLAGREKEIADIAGESIEAIARERGGTQGMNGEDLAREANRRTMDRVRETQPTLYDEALQQMPAHQRAMMGPLGGVMEVAHGIVNRIQNPYSWFGVGRAADLFASRMAYAVPSGMIGAYGAARTSAMEQVFTNAGKSDVFARAFGVAAANMSLAMQTRSLIRDVVRAGKEFTGKPIEWLQTRMEGAKTGGHKSVRTDTEEETLRRMKDYTGEGITSAEEQEALLTTARTHASNQLAEMTGVTPERAKSLVASMDEKDMALLHHLYYGHAVDGMIAARQQALVLAQQRVAALQASGGTSKKALKDLAKAQQVVANITRYTLISERALTAEGAKELLDLMVAAATPEIAEEIARQAIRKFDLVAHTFDHQNLKGPALVEEMRGWLQATLKDDAKSLPHAVTENLAPDVQRWMDSQVAILGEGAYRIAFTPEDAWGLVSRPDGSLSGANIWVDATNEHAVPWRPLSRFDVARLRLSSPIRGSRILLEARQAFVRDGVTKGLTKGQSEALFQSIRRMGEANRIQVRGLSKDQIWEAASKVEMPADVRLRLGPRGITEMIARAYAGDIATVGVTSRLSGLAKQTFAGRADNFIGRIAEDVYPKMRFTYSPLFWAQEWVEGPFFNILRGIKPGFHWTDKDVAWHELLGNMADGGDNYVDQQEFVILTMATDIEVRRTMGSSTAHGQVIAEWGENNARNARSLKALNKQRMEAKESADRFYEGVNSINPALWNQMVDAYTYVDPRTGRVVVPDKATVMLQYFGDRGVLSDDTRAMVARMDGHKPAGFGRDDRVNLSDVAASFGKQSGVHLTAHVRATNMSQSEFERHMLSVGGGADPEYIRKAWLMASGRTVKEWRDDLISHYVAGGRNLSDAGKAADAFLNLTARFAKTRGETLLEVLNVRLTGGPQSFTKAADLPKGVYTQGMQMLPDGTWVDATLRARIAQAEASIAESKANGLPVHRETTLALADMKRSLAATEAKVNAANVYTQAGGTLSDEAYAVYEDWVTDFDPGDSSSWGEDPDTVIQMVEDDLAKLPDHLKPGAQQWLDEAKETLDLESQAEIQKILGPTDQVPPSAKGDWLTDPTVRKAGDAIAVHNSKYPVQGENTPSKAVNNLPDEARDMYHTYGNEFDPFDLPSWGMDPDDVIEMVLNDMAEMSDVQAMGATMWLIHSDTAVQAEKAAMAGGANVGALQPSSGTAISSVMPPGWKQHTPGAAPDWQLEPGSLPALNSAELTVFDTIDSQFPWDRPKSWAEPVDVVVQRVRDKIAAGKYAEGVGGAERWLLEAEQELNKPKLQGIVPTQHVGQRGAVGLGYEARNVYETIDREHPHMDPASWDRPVFEVISDVEEQIARGEFTTKGQEGALRWLTQIRVRSGRSPFDHVMTPEGVFEMNPASHIPESMALPDYMALGRYADAATVQDVWDSQTLHRTAHVSMTMDQTLGTTSRVLRGPEPTVVAKGGDPTHALELFHATTGAQRSVGSMVRMPSEASPPGWSPQMALDIPLAADVTEAELRAAVQRLHELAPGVEGVLHAIDGEGNRVLRIVAPSAEARMVRPAPAGFIDQATDVPGLAKFWEGSEGALEDLPEDGFWHVTTGRTGVLKDMPRTRDELGFQTMGGGPTDTISITYDPAYAQMVYESLSMAVQTAKGVASPEEFLAYLTADSRFGDDVGDLAGALRIYMGTMDDDEIWQEIERKIRLAHQRGDLYTVFQQTDKDLYHRNKGAGIFGTDKQAMAARNLDDITMLKVAIKEDPRYPWGKDPYDPDKIQGWSKVMVPDERELRLHAGEVHVIEDVRPRRGQDIDEEWAARSLGIPVEDAHLLLGDVSERSGKRARYQRIHYREATGDLDATHRRLIEAGSDLEYGVLAQQRDAARAVAESDLLRTETGRAALAQRTKSLRDLDPTGDVLHQRGPRGVRGATARHADGTATLYIGRNADVSTAIHEAMHIFRDQLDPSAEAAIIAAYTAETGSVPKGFSKPVEEWMAKKFEHYAISGEAPDAQSAGLFNAFAKWGEDSGFKAQAVDPAVKAVFDKALALPSSERYFHYNADEQRVWGAGRAAVRAAEEQAHSTHYYRRGRTWTERTINHPYLGLYPASYMWGKVLPEMARFLLKKPFGLDAPLGGLALATNVYNSVALQATSDTDLHDFMDSNPALVRVLSLLTPGMPWDIPVNMPLWARKAEEVQLENERRAGTSTAQRSYDPFGMLQQMIVNAGGLGRDVGYVQSISQQMTQGTMTDPAELKKAAKAREANVARGGPQAPIYDRGNPAFQPDIIEQGNIDIATAGLAENPDGTTSAARSISVERDGKVYLIPTVVNGRQVSTSEAIAEFDRTGQHLGVFRDAAAAQRFAGRLHASVGARYRQAHPAAQQTPGVPIAS
jgi:hypothetical protein